MSRPPSAATLAARLEMERAKVRASFLQAKHRVITARLKQGRKQLPLPLEDVA